MTDETKPSGANPRLRSLLDRLSGGDTAVISDILQLVFEQIRRLAIRQFRSFSSLSQFHNEDEIAAEAGLRLARQLGKLAANRRLITPTQLDSLITHTIRYLLQELVRKHRRKPALPERTNDQPGEEELQPERDAALLAKAFTLEAFVSEGTDPHALGEAVVKLWEAANEYHMARGGGVLTFDEFKQMIPALVPVGPETGG